MSLDALRKPGDPESMTGRMHVQTAGGDRLVFRMFRYSLILIRHEGRLWAGRFGQLEPGWACRAATMTDRYESPAPLPDEVDCENVIVDDPPSRDL